MYLHAHRSTYTKPYLFLVAAPVGHLQIMIKEVQAQLVNGWLKKIVFHQAEEKIHFRKVYSPTKKQWLPIFLWQAFLIISPSLIGLRWAVERSLSPNLNLCRAPHAEQRSKRWECFASPVFFNNINKVSICFFSDIFEPQWQKSWVIQACPNPSSFLLQHFIKRCLAVAQFLLLRGT